MVEYNADKTTVSNMADNVDSFEITPRQTDSAQGINEFEWINPFASQYLGYYKKIPELKTAIDMRATWTVGKGYTCESTRDEAILDNIRGKGKETFCQILYNMAIARRIYGDTFAEIIYDKVAKQISNIKVLDPASIKIVTDAKGIIIRYEQINKSKKVVATFQPNEILHLMNKAVADEVHGVSDIEAVEDIIKANKESFDDFKTVVHRNVVPLRIIYVDLDDQTKIDELTSKYEKMINNKEVLFVPKGTMEVDMSGNANNNSIFNPLPWREHLKNYFFQVVGIPQIILGSSGEFTESTAKIAYIAFQQSVEQEQKDIEEQLWNQLKIRIDLSFPTTIQNELISDQQKDKAQGAEMQPADMQMTQYA